MTSEMPLFVFLTRPVMCLQFPWQWRHWVWWQLHEDILVSIYLRQILKLLYYVIMGLCCFTDEQHMCLMSCTLFQFRKSTFNFHLQAWSHSQTALCSHPGHRPLWSRGTRLPQVVPQVMQQISASAGYSTCSHVFSGFPQLPLQESVVWWTEPPSSHWSCSCHI